MTIETGNYLNDLDETRPFNTDLVAEGDDHLRLLKLFLQNTFPLRGVPDKAVLAKPINFTVGLTEVGAVYNITGATTATMPAVSGLPVGTHYWFWAGTNAVTIGVPDAATINGAATLYVESGAAALVVFDGSNWVGVPLSGAGGGGSAPVNLIAGTNVSITGTYPDKTINASTLDIQGVGDIIVDSVSYPTVYVEYLGLSAPPAESFRAEPSSNQTLLSVGFELVHFDAILFSTASDFTGVAFTPANSGKFFLTVQVTLYRAADARRPVVLELRVNTFPVASAYSDFEATTSGDAETRSLTMTISGVFDLTDTDTVEVYIKGRAGDIIYAGWSSSFNGTMVGV